MGGDMRVKIEGMEGASHAATWERKASAEVLGQVCSRARL